MKHPVKFTACVLIAIMIVLTACNKTAAPRSNKSPSPITQDYGNVAILVVDDFGFGRPGATVPSGKDETCTAATNDVGSGGAGDSPPKPPYSHGELVYRVLKTDLGASGLGSGASVMTPRTLASGGSQDVETSTEWTYAHHAQTYTVRLEAVHIDAYRTSDVINRIKSRINDLRKGTGTPSSTSKFQRFVLNLSFVVIPCNVGLWIDGSNGPSGDAKLLDTYMNMVGSDPELTRLSELVKAGNSLTAEVLTQDEFVTYRQLTISAFYNSTSYSDEKAVIPTWLYANIDWSNFTTFVQQLTGPSGPVKVIPVGAAGNGAWYSKEVRKQLPFPFAPALWDGVVSASAGGNTGRADYSNSGEVTLDGTGPTALDPLAHGTSFAAPRLSAKEAIWLLKTGLAECNGNQPPLGYVSLGPPPTTETLVLSNAWQNLDSGQWSGTADPCPNFDNNSKLP
jgi:hypothetical protein